MQIIIFNIFDLIDRFRHIQIDLRCHIGFEYFIGIGNQ